MGKRNRKYSQVGCIYLCQNFIFNEQYKCGCNYFNLDDFYSTCNSTSIIKNDCQIKEFSRLFLRNFYSINVYYSKLKYTYISQSPKLELFGLISNLGGLFSLFLGFSFVSLMDLFEIIFFYLRLVCSN